MLYDKIKSLFQKKRRPEIPPIPSWEEIVEMMHDKQLDAFSDEVVRVIYSKDKTMRYVVLKSEKGFFTYLFEAIYQFDADEWKYVSSDKNALPAMWEPVRGSAGKSIFVNVDELLKEMQTEPEYKRYF